MLHPTKVYGFLEVLDEMYRETLLENAMKELEAKDTKVALAVYSYFHPRIEYDNEEEYS